MAMLSAPPARGLKLFDKAADGNDRFLVLAAHFSKLQFRFEELSPQREEHRILNSEVAHLE